MDLKVCLATYIVILNRTKFTVLLVLKLKIFLDIVQFRSELDVIPSLRKNCGVAAI